MRSDPATIQAALEHMSYPKRKEEILEYAKTNDLSEDIMSDLQEISDRIYENPLDIRDEFEQGRQSGAARQPMGENEQSPADERGAR